jgi:hypothetical protein
VGNPFQIETVAITDGWKYDDTFTVEWTVSGDEGPIDHYEVSLISMRPDQVVPFGATLASANLAAGTRQFSTTLPARVGPPIRYLAPVVVAVPSDPALTPHERIGPAKAVFPAGTTLRSHPELQNTYISYTGGPPVLNVSFAGPVSFGGQPAGLGRAVWAAGEVESHNGILFDNASPGWNIGVRPEPGEKIRITLKKQWFTGKHRLIACVGFLGSSGGNLVTVVMRSGLREMNGAGDHLYPDQSATLTDPVGGPPPPMKFLEQVVDEPTDANWAGDTRLWINFHFEGGAVDPAHPPALFGVRVIPEP